MTTSTSPTRRDTFAFVLTMFGSTFWAVIPVSVFFRTEGVWNHVGVPIIFATGAFIGAWSGTTVWRHVSWIVPAVAAGVTAAMGLAMRSLARGDLSAVEAISVVAAMAGGASGTVLGWRARGPQRALVAAWITLGGPMLVGVSLTLLDQLANVSAGDAIAWIVLLAFVPSSVVAALLCRGVRPARFAVMFFGLSFTAMLLMHGSGNEDNTDGGDSEEREPSQAFRFGGALVACGVITAICSIPVRIAFRRHPETADLPTAQIRGG